MQLSEIIKTDISTKFLSVSVISAYYIISAFRIITLGMPPLHVQSMIRFLTKTIYFMKQREKSMGLSSLGIFIKYLTISFRYSHRKETRLFFRNEPPPLKEKPGFLRGSQKKCIKNF
ncbi:Uncharacterized protein dnm_074570 [Desulfonema magnum]|uniref:Uncharacterized protein n=1 Tax=Desulfonema magnum TaxID=45655 RepID=A0A975BUI0_9BACT|nr:Uncharacterized protein dnm_074570 [Desulfonema magnum]